MPRDNSLSGNSSGNSSRRKFIGLVGGGALTTTLAGCLGDDSDDADDTAATDDDTDDTAAPGDDTDDAADDGTEEQLGGGNLTFAQSASPLRFDPIDETDAASTTISAQVFTHLYRYDDGFDIVAEPPHTLASSLPELERDGQRWIIEIVDHAEFHNGDPVTAEDVQYTIEQPLEEETNLVGSFGIVEDTELIDDHTIQIDLEHPFEGFEHSLHQRIVPKEARENNREDFGLDVIVGSGPFQVTDWAEGEFVRFERWDDFWGDELPNVESMEFVPIEENTTRFTELAAGDVDVMEDVPPQLYDQFDDDPGVEVQEEDFVSYFYAAFNWEGGETTKPEVREAIDYCFTVEDVVANQVEPVGSVLHNPLPDSLAEEWDLPLDEYEAHWNDRDIDRAQELFEEAGVPDDWTCEFVGPPGETREQVAISIANGIEQAGYSANVRSVDWGSFNEITAENDPDEVNVHVVGLTPAPDPYEFLDLLFHSEGPLNDAGYSNERVDELTEESQQAVGFENRQPLFEEAIDIILEERAHLPLYNQLHTYGVSDNVSDFGIHPIQGSAFFTQRNNVSVQD